MTIVDTFYKIGSYEDEDEDNPSYISETDVETIFTPLGAQTLQALLGDVKTITVGVGYTTGDLYDDRIIALFAVSMADQEYDNIHVDPETGDRRNFNYEAGYQMVINRYGVVNKKGDLVPPVQGTQSSAGMNILKIEMDV